MKHKFVQQHTIRPTPKKPATEEYRTYSYISTFSAQYSNSRCPLTTAEDVWRRRPLDEVLFDAVVELEPPLVEFAALELLPLVEAGFGSMRIGVGTVEVEFVYCA